MTNEDYGISMTIMGGLSACACDLGCQLQWAKKNDVPGRAMWLGVDLIPLISLLLAISNT
jgi:hypothetical protein